MTLHFKFYLLNLPTKFTRCGSLWVNQFPAFNFPSLAFFQNINIYIWSNYALLQLCYSLPELKSLPNINDNLKALIATEKPRSADIVSWLVDQAKSSTASLEAFDQLRDVNSYLQENNRRVWLLYDELDTGWTCELWEQACENLGLLDLGVLAVDED